MKAPKIVEIELDGEKKLIRRKKEQDIIDQGYFAKQKWEDVIWLASKRQKYKKEMFKEIDILLSDFIGQALSEENLKNIKLDNYGNIYTEFLKIKKPNKNDKEKLKEPTETITKEFERIFSQNIKLLYSEELISLDQILGKWWVTLLKKKIQKNWEKKTQDNTMNTIDLINLYENKTEYFRMNEVRKPKFLWQKKWSIIERILRNYEKFIKNRENFLNLLRLIEKVEQDEDKKLWYKQSMHNYMQLKEFFELDFYKSCILQEWIDKYNQVIGELNSSEMIGQLKQVIKNQNKLNKKEDQEKIEEPRKLLILDKQILWNKDNISEIEIKNNDNYSDFTDKFIKFINDNNTYNANLHDFFSIFFENYRTKNLDNIYQLDKIHISRNGLKEISSIFFSDYSALSENKVRKDTTFKKVLNSLKERKDISLRKSIVDKYNVLSSTLESMLLAVLESYINEVLNSSELKFDKSKLDELNSNDKKIKKSIIADIYGYCMIVKKIYNIVSRFYPIEIKDKKIIEKETDQENVFYDNLNSYFRESKVLQSFNLFRNFLSQKEYKTDKIKIDFKTSWMYSNKWELEGIILRKNEKYYLGILTWNKTIYNLETINDIWDVYEVLYYKKHEFYKIYARQFVDKAKSLWLKITNLGSHKGDNQKTWEAIFHERKWNLNKTESKQIIDILFDMIENYTVVSWKCLYPWIQKILDKKEQYFSIEQLINDYEKELSYHISFKNISKEEIERNENLLLFEIYSKDFNEHKKSNKEDRNTTYFKALFDDQNIDAIGKWEIDSIFELEAGSIFFREKSINNKNYIQTKEIRGSDGEIIKQSQVINNEKSIEKGRYTENKLLTHLTITMNYKTWEKYFHDFNKQINNVLKSRKDEIKFIWVDRGEKYLAYAILIDKNGKILDKKPLNWENNKYRDELVKREKEMMESRKTRQAIWSIKELKEWRTSYAVNEVVKMAIENNAMICLENLSSWFKNSRKKIDRQVYDKFEQGLIKKLNYYFDKASWNHRKWMQLTPYFYKLTADNIDKAIQLWILLYVPPSYTSQSCPNCGYIRDFYIDINASIAKIKEKLEPVQVIRNNDEKIFTATILENTFYSDVDRLVKERKVTKDDKNTKVRQTSIYNITNSLKQFFEDKNILLTPSINLLDKLWDIQKWDREQLGKIFNIRFQIRNSQTEIEWNLDFLACAKCHYHSNQKDSITIWTNRNIEELENADANGAYHIAIKWNLLFTNIVNEKKNEKWEKDSYVTLEQFKKHIKWKSI